MNNLFKKQQILWARIRTILWENWDPIGVYKEDATWDDEYDSYVPQVFRLALEGKDAVCIAKWLDQNAQVNMGLSGNNTDRDLRVAELIIEAKVEILG